MIFDIYYPPISVSEAKKRLNSLPPSYCNILIKNKKLESETIGKKVYVTERSIEKILKEFKPESYYTVKQCNEKLTELNLKDDYVMIKFMGDTPKFDFNTSVKQLVEKQFLELDPFIGKFITIESFEKCVVTLKRIIEENDIQKNEDLKNHFIQTEMEKRLKAKMDIWNSEYLSSKTNHTPFNKRKPKLSVKEIKEIENEADRLYSMVPTHINGEIEKLPNKGKVTLLKKRKPKFTKPTS